MSTIWKFILSPYNPATLMPKGAKILTAAEQREQLFIWAEVDPAAPTETRAFEIFGTGDEIPNDVDRQYIGTAFFHGGSRVFHVYEPKEAA